MSVEQNYNLREVARFLPAAIAVAAGILALSNVMGVDRAHDGAKIVAAADANYQRVANEVALENAIPVSYRTADGEAPRPDVSLFPQSRDFLPYETVADAQAAGESHRRNAWYSCMGSLGMAALGISNSITRRVRGFGRRKAPGLIPPSLAYMMEEPAEPTFGDRLDAAHADRVQQRNAQVAATAQHYDPFSVHRNTIDDRSLVPA
jgi:hypothetical protein